MNARLYEIEGRAVGEGKKEEDGGMLGDGSQHGRCSDLIDDWIGKASGYADFDHVTITPISPRTDVNFPSHESRRPSYGPSIASNVCTLFGNIAAPSSDVTSHVRDNTKPQVCDTESMSCATVKPFYVPNASCNMACNIVPTPCNVVSNANCIDVSTTMLHNDSRLVPQSAQQFDTCMTDMSIPKNCQLGSIDVEDLSLYFDASSDNSRPPSIRARKSKHNASVDQPRQDCRNHLDINTQCDLSSCASTRRCNFGSNEPRPNSLASNNTETRSHCIQPSDLTRNLGSSNLEYEDLELGNLRSCNVGFDDLALGDIRARNLKFNESEFTDPVSTDVRPCGLKFGDPRLHSVREGYDADIDGSRPCSFGTCEIRELGRNVLARNHLEQSDLELSNWFCNYYPELVNFCNEERWLQCPASDRCPIYDTTYSYNASTLPPCMYENLQTTYNDSDNWYNDDYAEEEQLLLEDYLSNEKRKERSRDAARCRRSKETDIFTELAAALPIASEQAAHLDKASVMRLAIAYLKTRAVIDSIPASEMNSEPSAQMDELFPKALNGFMLVLSNDGNMVYLSENVSDYLGISQMDMMGQSVYEYSHPCDHDELRECLSSKCTESNEKRACSFFLRLKCTLTSKGRKVNLKSASYKVIHCIGRLIDIRDSNSNTTARENEERGKEDESTECDTGASLVLVGCPIPHPSNIEIPLGRHTFLSKHSLNMKFTYADEKLVDYLGWHSEELMGRSVFEFYHALDNVALDKCFKCLFNKGQCETVAYRFLSKKGGYAWVVTQATLIHCSKQQKPISVVCVNYILSGVEHEDEVCSVHQLAVDANAKLVKSEKSLSALESTDGSDAIKVALDNEEEPVKAAESIIEHLKSDHRQKPLAVTASIFRSTGNDKRDNLQKDNTFSRSAQEKEDFVDVRNSKESLEDSIKESLKENDEQVAERQNCRSPSIRRSLLIQKPAAEHDSLDVCRRNRPQAVTRHLFAPLAPIIQQQQDQQQQLSCRPAPQTATASIFAPRTEDMNKGFLTFSEDQPGLTMLKDEPEDLTHLAPTAGDVCVPLEDTPFLSDMLDEFILVNDNYSSLLSPECALTPELRSADFGESLKDTDLMDGTKSKEVTDPLADSDPFMYGDSPESPCSVDPSTVSPLLSKYQQSPERSVDSLGSSTGGSRGDGLSEDEMLMLGITDSMGDDELALRAPYIPMSDQDEALELLISDDMVMWSPSQSSDKGSLKWLVDDREQRSSESSLAQLLRTDQLLLRRYNDHGGGLVNPAQIFGHIPKKNAPFELSRWCTNQEQNDRPSKRVHASSVDTDNKHKRFKCENSLFEHDIIAVHPEETLLNKQQRMSTTPRRKSTSLASCSSQLLRRLVSQTPSVSPHAYNTASSCDLTGDDYRRDTPDRARVLDDIIDLAEAEGDRGGGGGEGDSRSNDDEDLGKINMVQRTPSCGSVGSSVLMNLLVSGCDDALIDSSNMPTSLSKHLTSPLSINVDNQMVPQSTEMENIMSLDHLSPDTRKHLIGPFTGGGTMGSPSTSSVSFDSFDYDVSGSTANLLQIGPHLLGTLLD